VRLCHANPQLLAQFAIESTCLTPKQRLSILEQGEFKSFDISMFSKREREVLALKSLRYKRKEIANLMGVSDNTVKEFERRIRTKVGGGSVVTSHRLIRRCFLFR